MTTAAIGKIFRFEFSDLIRSKWVVLYSLGFFLITELVFRIGGQSGQVLLSLLNVTLILIPLVCIVYGTIYFYNARAFTELMLSQPISRLNLFLGQYFGMAIPLSLGFALGISLPFIWHGFTAAEHISSLISMVFVGIILTLIFLAFAFLIVSKITDRVKGLGTAILLWLFFAVFFDGLMLIVINVFADYSLDRFMLILAMLNPVDLARVYLLMNFDISALMGYTGALFENFFGSGLGLTVTVTVLALWVILPLVWAGRSFKKMDF